MAGKFPIYVCAFCSCFTATTGNAIAAPPGSVLVAEGGQVDIACLQGSSKHQVGSVTQFSWTDSWGDIPSPDRFVQLGGGSVLRVLDARAQHTGLYTCTAKASSQQYIMSHYLTVYRYPTISYTDEFLYEVGGQCTPTREVEIVTATKTELCKGYTECDFTVTSQCQESHDRSSDVVRLSTELQLPSAYKTPSCSMSCVIQDMHLRLSQEHVVLEQLVLSRVLEHRGIVSGLITGSNKRTEQKVCPAGHQHYGSNICVACTPGHFSPTPGSLCLACELGFYQQHPGETSCTPCGVGLTTRQTGTSSSLHCLVPGSVNLSASQMETECTQNTGAVAALACVMVLFMVSTGVLGYMYYSLRRKIQNQEAERSEELGMKISPSMRSYLDKHPPINVEGKTYVPLGKMSKFDSLAQMVWSGFGKRQRKAEAEQQSASSLEEEVFHPSTTTSVPRVKSRNKSQTRIFPSLEIDQRLLGQVSKNRVIQGPRAGRPQQKRLQTRPMENGSD